MPEGIRLKQNGPMRIPVIMYAVTLGSFIAFVTLVAKKPNISIIAIDITIVAEPADAVIT